MRYLKFLNHSKKLDKTKSKNESNPDRRFTRAYGKSITRKFNYDGKVKKALKNMTFDELDAYKTP